MVAVADRQILGGQRFYSLIGVIMQLSKQTFDILKNFSTINKSIIVREGNIIRTISQEQNICACAKTEETFPRDFCIYELPRFLAAIDLLKQPELEFKQNYVQMSKGNNTIAYYYAAMNMVQFDVSQQEMDIPTSNINVKITQQDLKSLLQMATVLGLKEVALIGTRRKTMTLGVIDPSVEGDNFAIDTGIKSPGEFRAIFSVDNFRLLPGDYNCTISTKDGCGYFDGASSVQYWIALEEASTFSSDVSDDEEDTADEQEVEEALQAF